MECTLKEEMSANYTQEDVEKTIPILRATRKKYVNSKKLKIFNRFSFWPHLKHLLPMLLPIQNQNKTQRKKFAITFSLPTPGSFSPALKNISYSLIVLGQLHLSSFKMGCLRLPDQEIHVHYKITVIHFQGKNANRAI